MSPAAVLAGIIQQPQPNIFPHGVRTIEAQRISLLNLSGAKAAQAFHAKHVSRNLGQPTLLDR
jgi:hypothetical protein